LIENELDLLYLKTVIQ